jgi:hypothetical protein
MLAADGLTLDEIKLDQINRDAHIFERIHDQEDE